MERITFSPELSMSRIVYGMWRLGDGTDTAPSDVQAKIEACLEQGITTMDQADIYGGYEAEAILGTALKATPSLRDKIEIITKCDIVAPVGRHSAARVKYYDTSEAHITSTVETSLKEMAIDHIDLLLIHRPDPLMDPLETGATLDKLVDSGKVRAVGVSNFKPWDFTLLQSAMNKTLITNQIEMSLMQTQAFTNGDLAFHQEHSIPLMAWSPLGGGSLFSPDQKPLMSALEAIATEQNVDASAVAIAWLLRHPSKIIPVLGTNNLSRIAHIGNAARVTLDRQTWFELYTLATGQEVA